MWGMESQRSIVRERMKLLLAAHHNEIRQTELTAKEGERLLSQGEPADQVVLLTEGTVAIQVRQPEGEPHTLAIVEAEELLGEMGLFGDGRHSADVTVIGGPARLIAVNGDQLLQAMLFDADLAIELLALLSQRCLQGNQLMSLLLDGIHAAHSGNTTLLEQTSQALRQSNHALSIAANQLRELQR